jgi:hypothetical protein
MYRWTLAARRELRRLGTRTAEAATRGAPGTPTVYPRGAARLAGALHALGARQRRPASLSLYLSSQVPPPHIHVGRASAAATRHRARGRAWGEGCGS